MEEGTGGFPSIRWGLTFGIFLAALGVLPVIWLLTNGYRTPLNQSELDVILRSQPALVGYYSVGNLVATLVLYFLAGFMTARDMGTIKPGMFAAGLAYVASSVVTLLVNLMTLRQTEASALSAFSAFSYLTDQVRAAFAVGYAVGICCNLIVGAVGAALIGALGALLGCAIYGRASYS